MPTYPVRNEEQRAVVVRAVQNRQLPFTVKLTKGAPRTIEQNKTQRMWLKEAEEQGDQTAEQYRAYCKLHFGVAIMKYESPEWAAAYDRIIKPLTYEQKLEMMAEPMDFPVTRCMSTKGKSQFMDKMHEHFTGLGFILTDPR